MKWRKVTAMGLTVIMALSMALTGCGKSGGNAGGTESKKTDTSAPGTSGDIRAVTSVTAMGS